MGVIPLCCRRERDQNAPRHWSCQYFSGCWRHRVWLGADLGLLRFVQRLVEGRENKKVAGSADLSPATSVEAISRADTLQKNFPLLVVLLEVDARWVRITTAQLRR